MMLDDWYTESDLGKIAFHCRCCLTDEIVSERFKYALGVDVPALDWWNAWKEPSDVFRKNLYGKIFKKAAKRIASSPSSTNKKRRITTPYLHIEEMNSEDAIE
jgi:murein L,D-transpeptidase YafK